jgi:hypothetical protein
MTTAPPAPARPVRDPLQGDALVLAVDARSHGPREVEAVLAAIGAALDGLALPTWASTHVVEHGGIHHVGALVWDDPPRHLDLLAVAHRALPPGGATLCRTTRGGARPAGEQGRPASAVMAAALEAAAGAQGRVVSFPGQATVTGALTVRELVARTAVDEVVGLAGTVVGPDDVVDTRGWLRPRWNAGRLELLVERGPRAVLLPFEQQHQIACCSSH